jgi:hypothetical protein
MNDEIVCVLPLRTVGPGHLARRTPRDNELELCSALLGFDSWAGGMDINKGV